MEVKWREGRKEQGEGRPVVEPDQGGWEDQPRKHRLCPNLSPWPSRPQSGSLGIAPAILLVQIQVAAGPKPMLDTVQDTLQDLAVRMVKAKFLNTKF